MKFASQNLRNASQIAKCEPLISTLIIVALFYKCLHNTYTVLQTLLRTKSTHLMCQIHWLSSCYTSVPQSHATIWSGNLTSRWRSQRFCTWNAPWISHCILELNGACFWQCLAMSRMSGWHFEWRREKCDSAGMADGKSRGAHDHQLFVLDEVSHGTPQP